MSVATVRRELERRRRQVRVLEQIAQRANDERDELRLRNAASDIDATNENIGRLEQELQAALEREKRGEG